VVNVPNSKDNGYSFKSFASQIQNSEPKEETSKVTCIKRVLILTDVVIWIVGFGPMVSPRKH
jgi:hypothetical protein